MIKLKAKKVTLIIDKTRGVMFRDTITPIYFETRWGVHTFFVRKPIIVVLLDNNDVVVTKTKLMPWRMFFWNPRYSRVLELPHDYVDISKIKVGVKISLS